MSRVMNYQNPRLIDELAAQYVIGTLRGAVRSRFEKVLQDDQDAAATVRRWEDYFVNLTTKLAPVQPRAVVWKQIRLRLGHARTESTTRWSGWLNGSRLAIAAGVAALAVGLSWWVVNERQPAQVVATVATAEQTQWWRIETRDARETLRVIASASITVDPTKSYELWALPDSGAAPVSLGLMPQTGTSELELSAAQLAALGSASKIAVSLEPRGGSPTGAPTGPVLFVAEVARG